MRSQMDKGKPWRVVSFISISTDCVLRICSHATGPRSCASEAAASPSTWLSATKGSAGVGAAVVAGRAQCFVHVTPPCPTTWPAGHNLQLIWLGSGWKRPFGQLKHSSLLLQRMASVPVHDVYRPGAQCCLLEKHNAWPLKG